MSTALPDKSRKPQHPTLKNGDRIEVNQGKGWERGKVLMAEAVYGAHGPLVKVRTDAGDITWRARANIRLVSAIERLADLIKP